MSSIPLAPIRTALRPPGDDEDDEEAGIYAQELRSPEAGSPTEPSWRTELYHLLEHPNSSPAAFLVHITTTFLIVFSAAVTVLETLPALHSRTSRVWFGIETALVALFTVEYVARVLAWSTSWSRFRSWFTSFFAIIDLLAIAPYYVEIALQADTSTFFRFSILRTFRLLRVFRPFRYSNTILFTIEVMFLSFQRSKHALAALSFFLVMTLVIFSTLIYFAERGTWSDALNTFVDADGEPSQLESIPAAAWFVLVTITTVGYGDVSPRSILGRLVTVPLLLSGLLLIALPSFVLGREFSKIWESMGADDQQPGAELRTHDDNVLMSPMTFASPLRARFRPMRTSAEDSPNPAGAGGEPSTSLTDKAQVTALSQEVQKLRLVVERQSQDMARILNLLRERTTQDTAP